MSTTDVLLSPSAAPRAARGVLIRFLGYVGGLGLTIVISVLLLRHLSVVDFGRYATVMSIAGIISAITGAGLGTVALRDLATQPKADRRRLLASLIGLRIVLTPLGTLVGTAFAIVVGYPPVMVVGILLVGAGLTFVNAQGVLMLPLLLELRLGRLTSIEFLRQLLTAAGVAILVAVGAGLLPFFFVSVVVGVGVVVATPLIMSADLIVAPSFDRAIWRDQLRQALPIATALAMNVIYFRVLLIMMSLLASSTETGLFALSFRIVEVLLGVTMLLPPVVLPLLSAVQHDRQRFASLLQKVTEGISLAAVYLVFLLVIVASPAIHILGGGTYEGTTRILRIQAFALLAAFLGQVWELGLIAMRRQNAIIVANGLALVLVIALGAVLIPHFGSTGGAIASVVGEAGLSLTLLGYLVRAEPLLRPRLAFIGKLLLAALAMTGCLFLPQVPAVIAAVIATVLFGGLVWATNAVPGDLLEVFGLARLRKGLRG